MISVLVKNTFVCWVLGRRDLILLIIRKEPENHRKSCKRNGALKKYSCSSVQGYRKAGGTEMSEEDNLNQMTVWMLQLRGNGSTEDGMNPKGNLRFSDSLDIWSKEDEKPKWSSGLYTQGPREW